MILHTENSQSYSSQTIEKQEFKITASAKAFKILSSNLYRNKVRAIIRELSTNAYDAHISAGHPEKPFDVNLPTQLEPIFWLRDYGIGMSHEQVMTLYTTYFESTKSDSNDFIGALGLGSKSPFSYVDSFTVTSYYEGMMRIYEMSLVGGVPNVAMLMECPTEEVNGIKISVSVRSEDIYRFTDEAKFVYSTFTVKPNLITYKNMQEQMCIRDIQKQDGYYYGDVNHLTGCRNGIYAVMGQILYPIWPNSSHISFPDIMTKLARGKSIFIEFGLGELDITPSREELSFDDSTVDTITNRIDSLQQTLLVDVMKRHENHTEPRKAWNLIHKEPSVFHDHLRQNVLVDGKKLTEWNVDFHWSSKRNKYRRFLIDSSNNVSRKEIRGSNGWNDNNLADISNDGITIVLNDDNKKILKSIDAIANTGNHRCDNIYVFNVKDNDSLLEHCQKLIGMYADGLCKVYINSSKEVVDLRNEYEKKYSVPVVKRQATISTSVLYLKDGRLQEVRKKILASDISESNFCGHYLLKYDKHYVNFNGIIITGNEETIRTAMIALKIDQVTVIRPPQFERIKKNTKATHLLDAMAELVENSSPKIVANNGTPYFNGVTWIRNLFKWIPETEQMFKERGYINNKKRSGHYLYEFMYQVCFYDSAFRNSLSDGAKKKCDMFYGRYKAIKLSTENKGNEISNAIPMVHYVVRHCGERTIQQYKEEIFKCI